MGFYFLHTNGQWSNHYPYNKEAPNDLPEEGGQWIQGDPSGNAWMPPPPFNLADAIKAVYMALPASSQYKYATVVSNGFLAIQQNNPILLSETLRIISLENDPSDPSKPNPLKPNTAEEIAAFQQIQALVEGA